MKEGQKVIHVFLDLIGHVINTHCYPSVIVEWLNAPAEKHFENLDASCLIPIELELF